MIDISPIYILQIILGLIACTIFSTVLILFVTDVVAFISRKIGGHR